MNGSHSGLDIRVNCHHLDEFGIEGDDGSEAESDVEGVGGCGDQ